jgi:cysteine-rich repeat protein
MSRHLRIAFILVAMLAFPASAALVFEASLQSGNYGTGQRIDTFGPNHGGSPHVLGIVDSAEGMTYTTTETSGRSNALINWVLSPADEAAFRTAGTVSFCLRADPSLQRDGWVLGNNDGFDAYSNGLGSMGSHLARRDNGTPADTADDLWGLSLATWHDNVWYSRPTTQPGLVFGPWYRVGYTWGGAQHRFEIWADGALLSSDDRTEPVLPWGYAGTAKNVGLGDNHARGIDAYGSAAGVTFKHVRLWTGAQPLGDTGEPCGVCGNGFVEVGEACDDGNTVAGDCCAADCQLEPVGSACTADGVACTTDACDATGRCIPAPDAAACDDVNPCTADACDRETGCTYVPQAGACADDGVACTVDACDATGGCAHTPADGVCDDGNACTADACNAADGCVYVPQAGACDDGDACTVDACESGACAGALVTMAGVRCRLDQLASACGETLPVQLGKRVAGKVRATHRLLTALERAAVKPKVKKVAALRRKITSGLAVISTWSQKAEKSTDARKQISATCRAAMDGKVSQVRSAVGTLAM